MSSQRQEHKDIERTFSDLHISGNKGKTNFIHNPQPQYQQHPTHNEPHLRSAPEPKNTSPLEQTVRHKNYPWYYRANHATETHQTEHDPKPNHPDIRQSEPNMRHTTTYYTDNENTTTSQPMAPKPYTRTTSLTFQEYRDAPNTSDTSQSTTTTKTNENNQTQIHKPYVTLQQSRIQNHRDTKSSTRQSQTQQENTILHQNTTRAEIHANPRPQHAQRVSPQQKPSTTQYLIDLSIPDHEPTIPYESQQSRERLHQSYRNANSRRQRAREELESIMQNDRLVEDLNRRLVRGYTHDSDTDTQQEYHQRQQPLYRQHTRELPREKSPIQSPRNKKHKYEQIPPRHTTSATQTRQERKEHTHKFKLTYDDDSLICQGNGWKQQFMKKSDSYYPEANHTQPQKSNTTTINTNYPFFDLQVNIATEMAKNQEQNEIQTETTANSSAQSLLHPLTSTPNDSIQHYDNNPPMSPTPAHNSNQTILGATPINNITQIPLENETTEDTQDSPQNTDANAIETLKEDNTPLDDTNETFQQFDGNATINETSDDDQKPDTTQNKRLSRNDLIEQEIASELKTINEPTHQAEYLAKHEILQRTSERYKDCEQKPPIIRRLTKHLNETREFAEQIKQGQQVDSQPIQTTTTKNSQDLPKSDNAPETPEYTDYSNPEVTRQLVERDRIIKEDITNYDKMESEKQKQKIKQQIEQMEHALNNLNMQLAAEELSNTNNDDEYTHTHTDEEENAYEHNEQFMDIEPNEEIEDQETCIPVNIITSSEFQEMESNLPHSCRERFEQAKDYYEHTKLNIDHTAMRLREKIETNDESPLHLEQTENEREHLIYLRKRQINLEEKINNIAKAGGKNNLNIIIPKFGQNMRDCRQWKSIPNFNPKHEDAMPFDTIWTLIATRGQREGLSEDAYKDVLESTLKGKALHYYTANSHLPLRKIIETLFNAFVTTKSRQQLRTQINTFNAEKNHNFRQTLERLRLLVREYYKDLPTEKRTIEEDAEMRRCISERKLADPTAVANVLRKQQESGYDGRPFDFLRELVRETDILQEAGNPYNQAEQMNMAIYSTATENETTNQTQGTEPKRIHMGNPGGPSISAKPRPPSREKLERLFRHSPRRYRPRSNSPNSINSRQQSQSPHRPTSPYITENTHRDTENRQRASRESEFYKRRLANQPRENTRNQPENNIQTQRRQTRQHSTEPQPRYSQYTNNNFPQNTKQRSSSVTPQYRRNNQFQNRRNYAYNDANYTPIGNPRKSYTHDSPVNYNRPFQNNRPRYPNERPDRSYSPYQARNYDPQIPTQRDNQYQNIYPPKYNQKHHNGYPKNNTSIFNDGIVSHKITYSGDKYRGGKINQEFSITDKCRKVICQDDIDHSYKQCPRNKSFQDRH